MRKRFVSKVNENLSTNNKRLEYLEKTVKLIDIANRVDDNLNDGEAREIIRCIIFNTKDYSYKSI